jgi:hypothetical protein
LNNFNLKEKIGHLILDDGDFIALENRLGGFCPFEALGVIKAEIRHSHFLSYLLSPFAEHGFGSNFLKEFLSSINEAVGSDFLDRLDIHLADLDDVDVFRETEGRIDLLLVIHSLKAVIAIELKVDSAESQGQLKKYKNHVRSSWLAEEGWRHCLIFMTPDGREPSDTDWSAVSYESITTAAEKVLSTSIGIQAARDLLGHYVTMIRRHHMEDEKLQELARTLWKKHDAALKYLMDHAPSNAFSQYLIEWAGTLPSKCSTPEVTLLPDRITRTYINFGIQQLDAILPVNKSKEWTKSGRAILIEINNTPRSLSIKLVVGPLDKVDRDHIINSLKTAGIKIENNKKFSTAYSKPLGVSPETLAEDEYISSLDRTTNKVKQFIEDSVYPIVEVLKDSYK